MLSLLLFLVMLLLSGMFFLGEKLFGGVKRCESGISWRGRLGLRRSEGRGV